jgi:hypothetical protein
MPSASQGSDGFAARAQPRGGSHIPAAYGSPLKLPQGTLVTKDFVQNPAEFAKTNTLNAYSSTESNFKDVTSTNPKERVPAPANPRVDPFISANDSKVTMFVHKKDQGNANMTFSPAGGPGVQAHYIPYVQQGEGGFGGVKGVPLHPQIGQPTMAVTGPLNGCAVHAFHNRNDNTLAFIHQANFDRGGPADLAKFQQKNPHLTEVASIKPSDYAHQIKDSKDPRETAGATVFAHYDQPQLNQPGQWKLMGQLNNHKAGAGPDGRPPLGAPNIDSKHPQFLEKPIVVP